MRCYPDGFGRSSNTRESVSHADLRSTGPSQVAVRASIAERDVEAVPDWIGTF